MTEHKIHQILNRLVEREVLCCASHLISECYKASASGDAFRDYEDELRQISERESPAEDVCRNQGYRLFQYGGDWFWHDDSGLVDAYITGDLRGALLHRFPKTTCAKNAAGTYVVSDGTEHASLGLGDTEATAWEEAYESMSNSPIEHGSFDSEEEAARDCMYENALDAEHDEVYEHWIVTKYFGDKLKEQGESVEEFCNLTIWGRCTTGQAISMDGVIRSVAEAMEILPGQNCTWDDEEQVTRAVLDYKDRWRVSCENGVVQAERMQGAKRLTFKANMAGNEGKQLAALASKMLKADAKKRA